MKINTMTAELTGIIIGDGCLYGNFGSYHVLISGHPRDDKKYYDILREWIFTLLGKYPTIKIHQRALRLIMNNKEFYNFFVKDLGMDYNGNKCHEVTIPEKILRNKKFVLSCIRGVFDTDGSVFTSDKPGSPDYPCIELTTVSRNLANQLFSLLKEFGYRIHIRRRDRENRISYVLYINGWEMVRKWYKEIGFTNPVKKAKAKRILVQRFG